MSRGPDDDGGDRHRCSACGAIDMDEMLHGHLFCHACGAVDGEAPDPEEQRVLDAMADRHWSGMPNAPERYTTETP